MNAPSKRGAHHNFGNAALYNILNRINDNKMKKKKKRFQAYPYCVMIINIYKQNKY